MSLDHILVTVVAVCFTGIGVQMRKQQNKQWRAFFFGGVTILAIVILSLIFGWQL